MGLCNRSEPLGRFDSGEYPNHYRDCNILLPDINGVGNINAFDIEPFLGLLFPQATTRVAN